MENMETLKLNNGLVRLPINHIVENENFRINQYYRLINQNNGLSTLFQAYHNYTIIVNSNLIIKI